MNRRRIAVVVGVWVTIAGFVAPAGEARAANASTVATGAACAAARAHYEDPEHNGHACTSLPATPVQKWSVTLNGNASYPLIAGTKVFELTTAAQGGWLYALDASSGRIAWGPVPLSATYSGLTFAYDSGRVFVDNFDGTVTAFSALTGRQLWSTPTSFFAGEPVALDGVLYVTGQANVFALSETTGAVLWNSGYLDGTGGNVAANSNGVFLAAGCSWFKLSTSTGAVAWSGNSGCSGGGGGNSFLGAGRDFESIQQHVIDQRIGKIVGSFAGTPAFLYGIGYFAVGSAVFAETIQTLKPRFTTMLPSGSVATSPVIAGSTLYVGSSDNHVYGLSTSSGSILWTGTLPAAPGSGNAGSQDLAVGEGLLVVPTGAIITAFG